MILIISNSDDVTADLVQEELARRGVGYCRFNTDEYPVSAELCFEYGTAGLTGSIGVNHQRIAFDDVSTVWYRKPDTPGVSPNIVNEQAKTFAVDESRAALTGLYNVLQKAFWVSRPERIRQANDKLLQLVVARRLGFEVPRTLVTSSPETARRFAQETTGNLVVKPLRAGQVDYPDGSIEVIYTTALHAGDLVDLKQVAYAPCLFQENIPKRVELRVTVIGRRMFTVALDSQTNEISRQDWRRDNASGVKYSTYQLPPSLADKCIAMMDEYGLEFSAFDLIVTPDGRHVFLENNPNGQWAWLDLELDLGMIPTMAAFLASGGSHCDN